MEGSRKKNGRARGKFLTSPPVIDLSSEKKDELIKDIFDNKRNVNSADLAKRAPVKISKLEKVALPALIVAAVIVGWSLMFNLFFYKTKTDPKKETELLAANLLQAVAKSFSYISDDLEIVYVAPSLNLSAGVGFLGDKIAGLAESGALKTTSLIESLNGI